MSLQLLALGAQGQQIQQMLTSNPLLAPILAASMTNSSALHPPASIGAPTGAPGASGLPGLLSGLPGMANPPSTDLAQQSQMLQAMSQLQSLFMLNNPGSAPNANMQSSALLQNQVYEFLDC